VIHMARERPDLAYKVHSPISNRYPVWMLHGVQLAVGPHARLPR
jgi:hypothetical protein